MSRPRAPWCRECKRAHAEGKHGAKAPIVAQRPMTRQQRRWYGRWGRKPYGRA